jgi:hypothetical protein
LINCDLGLLQPGQSVPFVIGFIPLATGSVTLTCEVRTNADNDPNSSNDTDAGTVRVLSLLKAPEEEQPQLSVRSHLTVTRRNEGVARGQVVLNNSVAWEMDSQSGPRDLQSRGRKGRNRVEAHLEPGFDSSLWLFDFSATRDFVPGSIRVESGSVASQDGRSIRFVLPNGANSPIRFDFYLSQQ